VGICRRADDPCCRCRGGGGSRSPRCRRDHRHHPRFGPPALCACPRPSSVGVGEGKIAAASALRPSLLQFGHSAPRSGGRRRCCRSGRRRAARRSSVAPQAPLPSSGVVRTCGGGTGVPFCNGTLNVSVFVHCGCRGLNMYVISARSRVFSSFSSTKTHLLVV
jgi:hypothetical protein